MSEFTTKLTRAKSQWALKVTTPEGETLEYVYGSEREARYFAAIFELGPSVIPALPRTKRAKTKTELRAAH